MDYHGITHVAKEPPLSTTEHPIEEEPTLERVADEVTGARTAIRELLRCSGSKRWTVRDIQASLPDWRGTIVHLALLDLCRRGEIELQGDLAVRVIGLADD